MGDVAMLVPVVHALATLYPDVHVTVLSRPFAQSFFEGLAPNVSFMAADLTTEYKGIRGLNALYRRLAAKQFTHIADMHGVLRSHYLRMRFLLNNYRVEHIDKHRKERQALIRPENKVFKQLPTSFRNYAEVLHRLGFPLKPTFRSIFGEGKGNLRLLPPEIGEKKAFQKWIGIAPFAAHKGKIYPIEKMEQAMQLILKDHPNTRIFLFHGKGEEAELMRQWTDRYPEVTSASTLLNGIQQELILMSHLDKMISMDSGNMHLASLVACPVVCRELDTPPTSALCRLHRTPEFTFRGTPARRRISSAMRTVSSTGSAGKPLQYFPPHWHRNSSRVKYRISSQNVTVFGSPLLSGFSTFTAVPAIAPISIFWVAAPGIPSTVSP